MYLLKMRNNGFCGFGSKGENNIPERFKKRYKGWKSHSEL